MINSESFDDPSLLWETCKAYIRGLAISYSITKERKQVEKQERLELELKRATKDHVNDASPANLEKLTVIRASLHALLLQQANVKILFSKQRLYEHGNKPNKYLSYLLKNKSGPQFITSIMDSSGKQSFDSGVITATFKQFYSDLCHTEYLHQQYNAMVNFFDHLTLSTISDEQRMALNAPISREEALMALRSLQSG